MAPLDFAPVSRAMAAQSAGLSQHQARVATRIAQIPSEDFDAAVESERPPGTEKLANVTYLSTREHPDGWTTVGGELTKIRTGIRLRGDLPRGSYHRSACPILKQVISALEDIESRFPVPECLSDLLTRYPAENRIIRSAVGAARKRLQYVLRELEESFAFFDGPTT